jgi:uncharacterized protein involved in high-affinity Fe2+ transport
MHLNDSETDIHIMARENCKSYPDLQVVDGDVRGGFMPYLFICALITNKESGAVADVILTPRINIDSFHYSRNMKLPGEINEAYSFEFFVEPPESHDLSTHFDWGSAYGEQVLQAFSFRYEKVL